MLSVIVPTRNEQQNVRPLVERVDQALADLDWELLFVDDSDDGTPQAVRALDHPRVRLVHRAPGRRVGGLAGAVCTGFAAAKGTSLAVMDGDLQHDPARLPDLAAALDAADVAVASRFVAGGGGGAGLAGGYREMASHVTRTTVRTLFPRIWHVRDPLAGYFAVRRSVLDGVELRPEGFKILLELLVKGQQSAVTEIPFELAPRADGMSKADLHEGLRFGKHVLRLRLGSMTDILTSPRLVRAVQFGGVSVGSMALTQVLLAGLQAAGLAAPVANAVAVTLAAAPTFLFSRRWVWGWAGAHGRARQGALFWLTAVVGLLLSTLLVALLVPDRAPIIYANLVNLAAFGAVWVLKYLFLDGFVFAREAWQDS